MPPTPEPGAQDAVRHGAPRWRSIALRLALWGGTLVVALAITAILFLDAAAARLASAAASRALGTEVRIAAVHIGLFSGVSTVSGVDVREPTGFPDGSLLTVATTRIDVGLRDLLRDVITVNSVDISGVHLAITESGGRVNLQVIADSLAAAPAESAASKEASASPEVIIRRLALRDIRVTASGTAATLAGGTIDVRIPDIEVSDLGTRSTATEVATAVSLDIMRRLTLAVVEARINGLSGTVVAQLGSAAESFSAAAQSLFQQASDALRGAGQRVGDVLGDLFKGK